MNEQVSNPSQKRPADDSSGTSRPKRAKYTSAACNECKRCKVKCIRFEDDATCQRCAAMHMPCVIPHVATHTTKYKKNEISEFKQLSDDVASLRRQLAALTATVHHLSGRVSTQSPVIDLRSPRAQSTCRAHDSPHPLRGGQPQEPQFVGPTRSAFSFNIAETALSRMGISTGHDVPVDPSSTASSREPTPDRIPRTTSATLCSEPDCLLSFPDEEIVRLVGIYQEEVVCCHPILETRTLMLKVPRIMERVRHPCRPEATSQLVGRQDAHLLRIVVATAITTEPQGKSDVCDKLIATVKRDVGAISSHFEVGIKDIQLMAMLSIYFCHVGEELFAWRAVGRAARQCLEMGLHRRQSLETQFQDADHRALAVQVFWVVYALDRRWSFGTSLSFALDDRDIDAKLPEPDGEHSYLKCMVTYGRLCSRVWEALPPYGSSLQRIPKETEDYLDFVTQNWLLAIPQDLQLRHPRLGLAPKSQPRVLHRLRTLCYLRGNYMRLLIHRHHVLTSDNVKADEQSARLVVDIAKDSIEVLVHLNKTSDIYVRQQATYHFYLLSGLAIMLLAVCHAPAMFAETCRPSFVSAVELVKGFSRHSSASRRLWKSIRGLLPVVRSLGAQSEPAAAKHTSGAPQDVIQVHSSAKQTQGRGVEVMDGAQRLWAETDSTFNGDLANSIPDVFDLSNDLMNIYDAFGSSATAHPVQPDTVVGNFAEDSLRLWEMDEVSRYFQDLI